VVRVDKENDLALLKVEGGLCGNPGLIELISPLQREAKF
jgi:hypothetical protein